MQNTEHHCAKSAKSAKCIQLILQAQLAQLARASQRHQGEDGQAAVSGRRGATRGHAAAIARYNRCKCWLHSSKERSLLRPRLNQLKVLSSMLSFSRPCRSSTQTPSCHGYGLLGDSLTHVKLRWGFTHWRALSVRCRRPSQGEGPDLGAAFSADISAMNCSQPQVWKMPGPGLASVWLCGKELLCLQPGLPAGWAARIPRKRGVGAARCEGSPFWNVRGLIRFSRPPKCHVCFWRRG